MTCVKTVKTIELFVETSKLYLFQSLTLIYPVHIRCMLGLEVVYEIVTIDSEVVGVGKVLLYKTRPLLAYLADLLVTLSVKHLHKQLLHTISQLCTVTHHP